MKRFFLPLIAFSFLYTAPQWANGPVMPSAEEPSQLIVNNRILAKVNGKTISVIDVMKKMDLFLQRNYPDLVQSKLARYQFYSSQWKETLAQIVDQELMITDSERLELKITDAEVREEMLDRFGPNIMSTLDQLEMSYEEARRLIHAELIVQRMTWFRVNSKVLSNVGPNGIKEAYKEFCVKNPSLEQWDYQVLSLRATNKQISEMLAKKAFDLLHSFSSDLNLVSDQIKGESNAENGVSVSLSPPIQVDEKNVSEAHKEVLKTLAPGSFSEPIPQVSRVDNSVVYRIFHLKEHSKKETPSFEKMAETLKEELLQRAFTKENSQYLTKLRERLGYDEKHMLEDLPSDFQPFAVR